MQAQRSKKLVQVLMAVALVFAMTTGTFASRSNPDAVEVRRIEMALPFTTVRVNQERSLWVEFYPYNATDQTLTWSSGNPEIASVDDDGVVTGVSPGTTEITAWAANGRRAICEVTVPGSVLTGIELQTSNADHTLSAVSGGESLGADNLRLAAETAAKATPKGERATVTYDDQTGVSTTALRSASFAAAAEDRELRLVFRTLGSGSAVQGQLTIDPAQASEEDFDIKLAVYADSSTTAGDTAAARQQFGNAAVIKLAHSGAFGMTVQVAAKADLTGMNPSALELYRYSGGAYTLLEDQSYTVDSNGYLHFKTGQGGIIVAVSGDVDEPETGGPEE